MNYKLIISKVLKKLGNDKWEYKENLEGYEVVGNYRVALNNTIEEVYKRRCYDFPIKNAKLIIDLGANIGLSTIFFKQKYPKAKVLCVEPAEENLSFLYRNIAGLDGVSVVDKPVSYKNEFLDLNKGVCSTSNVYSSSENGIASITMLQLLEGINNIDLLKIDIEGAEENLLLKNNQWLDKVDNIIVELHDMVCWNIGHIYLVPKVIRGLQKRNFYLAGTKEGIYWFKRKDETK